MFGFHFTGADAQPGLSLDGNGRLGRVAGIDELRQALVMLFSTRPGERAMMPEFGCELDRLIFEPNDATTAGLAIRIVSDAIARHEPRAIVDRLDAYADAVDPTRLVIDLTFRDSRTGDQDQLQFRTALDGGA